MVNRAKKIALMCLAVFVLVPGCYSGGVTQKPLIGITSVYKVGSGEKSTPSVSVTFAYVRAVLESGGVPVILPAIDSEETMRRYVDELDGLVLVGGADVPPSAYDEQRHETVKVMPSQRFEFERKLIPLWFESGKPMLGVCLGMQFANVMRGGSLIQDIPSQVGTEVNHRCKEKLHPVQIEPDSSLREILGDDEALVYSGHHQAVKQVGKGLKVVARSHDGVVEALERTDGPFGLFVQWHPEMMKDAKHRRAIYGALIRACTRRN